MLIIANVYELKNHLYFNQKFLNIQLVIHHILIK